MGIGIYSFSSTVNSIIESQKDTTNKLRTSIDNLDSGDNAEKNKASNIVLAVQYVSDMMSADAVINNINDNKSLLMVADNNLSTIQGSLVRARELALQSADEETSTEDRVLIQEEFKIIQQGIADIINGASYNTNAILNGTINELNNQANISTNSPMAINISNFSGLVSDVDISTQEQADVSITSIDEALDKIEAERIYIGSVLSRLENVISTTTSVKNDLAFALHILSDNDYIQESTNYVLIQNQYKAQLLTNSYPNGLGASLLSIWI